MKNPYLPMPVILQKVSFENEVKDIKTFDLAFENPADAESFDFVCGQFAMLSVPGVGEAPFGIASSPLEKETIQFTIKRYPKGQLTTSLHSLAKGKRLGLRGPFGNGYPMKELEKKNILLVGGGFALTTLRSVAGFILHESNRDRYKKLTMFVAARDPGEILYKDDLAQWSKRDDIEIIQTIDRPADGWQHKVGFAAPVLEQIAPSADNTCALVCGPSIMIKTCIKVLFDLGFPPERIINSLEMKMKCGIGICGRCNIGGKYICKDGPVFTYAELQQLSKEY
ncbi:MAG: FAD/NAD(P)-binding protein [Planctomycetota bacterium]